MIITKQIKISSVWSIILLTFILGGCHPSYIDIKELASSDIISNTYVKIKCSQIGGLDTIDICGLYCDLVYELEQDSSTRYLSDKINDYVLNGEILMLQKNHSLLREAIVPFPSVDSIYAMGYEKLLRKYFFCYDELNKENSCCLDQLHSVCGNSIYFGHRDTPCYYKEDDSIMNYEMQDYIISLLYKNSIYCSLDENGNIHLLNFNLKKEDFRHIPFPIVEVR